MSQYLEAMAIGDAIDVRGPSGLRSKLDRVLLLTAPKTDWS